MALAAGLTVKDAVVWVEELELQICYCWTVMLVVSCISAPNNSVGSLLEVLSAAVRVMWGHPETGLNYSCNDTCVGQND